MDTSFSLNTELLQPLQNIISDGWFDDICQMYGESLSNEMISKSVEETCDFFNIEDPEIVSEGWTTGVYPNNDFTLQDDVLIFNREQLMSMGITEQQGLDLVMTHEGAHRALQGIDTGFDSHQEELCCDFMAGVRAGLNGIDVSQMENSLIFIPESDTHPAGFDRVNFIEEGVRFAQEYYAEYNMAPTFSECLDYFKGEAELTDFAHDGQITLRPEIMEGLKRYNVSFEGKTVKNDIVLEQWGGGLETREVDICRKDGTSGVYEVVYRGKVVDEITSLSSGTRVKVNGKSFKIP